MKLVLADTPPSRAGFGCTHMKVGLFEVILLVTMLILDIILAQLEHGAESVLRYNPLIWACSTCAIHHA